MSINHQFVISCDQNPIPDRCSNAIIIQASPNVAIDAVEIYIRDRDWAIIEIPGKKRAHYCPYHRPVR